jgi:hypothetical protein
MISFAQLCQSAAKRSEVGLYHPSRGEANVARWRINGHRASILIWTVEEWERLAERPKDAQYYECGVWCALRLE